MTRPARTASRRLVDWAFDIYRDHAREFGDGLLRDAPQLEALIAATTVRQREAIAEATRDRASTAGDVDDRESLVDAAARAEAAYLLHDLLIERKNIPNNAATTWALTETYLLLHGLAVTADDDVVYDLIMAIGEGRVVKARAVARLSTKPVAWAR